MIINRPYHSKQKLSEAAINLFRNCSKDDWLEAFTHHPKLGDRKNIEKKFAATSNWAGEEQSGTNDASKSVLLELEQANLDYENKFGFTFILCATGKSATFMLDSLKIRLTNTKDEELQIAMEEQNKITKLRLEKLLL